MPGSDVISIGRRGLANGASLPRKASIRAASFLAVTRARRPIIAPTSRMALSSRVRRKASVVESLRSSNMVSSGESRPVPNAGRRRVMPTCATDRASRKAGATPASRVPPSGNTLSWSERFLGCAVRPSVGVRGNGRCCHGVAPAQGSHGACAAIGPNRCPWSIGLGRSPIGAPISRRGSRPRSRPLPEPGSRPAARRAPARRAPDGAPSTTRPAPPSGGRAASERRRNRAPARARGG